MDIQVIHHGNGIKYCREALGIRQEELACKLGEDWNQKKINILEQKALIEVSLLEKIAGALRLPVTAVKYFDKEIANGMISIIAVFPGHLEKDDGFPFFTIERTLELYVELALERNRVCADQQSLMLVFCQEIFIIK
jgi:transcriptional regulator with XRE-family HTH domain